jgi:Putative transposase/Transposase zinc-binding domain
MSTVPKNCVSYTRHRPELTPCYNILQEHLNTFIAERSSEGMPLADYILREFEAYLRCGIPAFGFLRLQCGDCKEEKIIAFSCKKRGFCPSCCGKRMSEAAAHLVDNVLPLVPYRQFVISFPIPLRFWLETNRKLYSQIHKLVIQEFDNYYMAKAKKKGIKDPMAGSISFTQRWGSALNLNPHMHVLYPDGVYVLINDQPQFRKIEAITDAEVSKVVAKISNNTLILLQKLGYLDEQGEVVFNPAMDELFQNNEVLTQAMASSITGKIAFGPNAGRYVTKVGSGFGYYEETPLVKGKRCASINGFSLHANTAINTHSRDKLEQLVRYIARGPLSNQRLELTPQGKVKLLLKSKWSDGTTHLLFTPSEFIEKLTALIPLPRLHLVRWSGVFAPNSPYPWRLVYGPYEDTP